MHRYILFDIDGTLIDSGGAGTRALNLAFRDLFSIPDAFAGIEMAGKTDFQIVREALARHGIAGDGSIFPEIEKCYIRHLEREMNNTRRHVKPGVLSLLQWLKARKDCVVGLLTGNLASGARVKLETMGLYGYFEAGAFGSDHEDRNSLLPIAVRRLSERVGKEVSFGDCVVIGDTPRDVECSKPYGARCIAVATGPYSYDSLKHTAADMVVETLRGLEEYLCAL